MSISPDSSFDDRTDDMILRIHASRQLRHDNLARLNAPAVVMTMAVELLEQTKRLVRKRNLTQEQVKDALLKTASDEALADATTRNYEVTLAITVHAPYIGDLSLEESRERLVPHLLDALKEAYEMDKSLASSFIKSVEEAEE